MSTVYENRTTSAGYRLPIQSRPRSSEFHQNCIPKEVKAQKAKVEAAPTGKHPEGEFSNCDAVTQDKIWKQCVETEKNGAKTW